MPDAPRLGIGIAFSLKPLTKRTEPSGLWIEASRPGTSEFTAAVEESRCDPAADDPDRKLVREHEILRHTVEGLLAGKIVLVDRETYDPGQPTRWIRGDGWRPKQSELGQRDDGEAQPRGRP